MYPEGGEIQMYNKCKNSENTTETVGANEKDCFGACGSMGSHSRPSGG